MRVRRAEGFNPVTGVYPDLQGQPTHDGGHWRKDTTENNSAEMNKYDVSVYPLKSQRVNANLTLPNKFFEFIQAQLAVAIGPLPEMVKLRQYDFGAFIVDFLQT